MAESVITEEMRRAIDKELNRIVFDVEKVLVRRFCEAVEDFNPRWQEFASPGLFSAIFAEGGIANYPFAMPLPRILDGGGEWEFCKPVKLGDTLTGVRKLADLQEKDGKLGRMLFVIRETTWTNQKDEVVAKDRTTSIYY